MSNVTFLHEFSQKTQDQIQTLQNNMKQFFHGEPPTIYEPQNFSKNYLPVDFIQKKNSFQSNFCYETDMNLSSVVVPSLEVTHDGKHSTSLDIIEFVGEQYVSKRRPSPQESLLMPEIWYCSLCKATIGRFEHQRRQHMNGPHHKRKYQQSICDKVDVKGEKSFPPRKFQKLNHL